MALDWPRTSGGLTGALRLAVIGARFLDRFRLDLLGAVAPRVPVNTELSFT